jgi:hypothetical protein
MTATDDFTIVLDEPGNMESCGVEVFQQLSQLWKLVQRYGMKTPLSINVVDSQSDCIRTLKAVRDNAGIWKLADETPPESAALEAKFPLIINSTDQGGNTLKVRVQLTRKHNSPEHLSDGTDVS